MTSRTLAAAMICLAAGWAQTTASRRIAVVVGAPYSADQVQTYTRAMPDGTSSTTSNVISHYARDSSGRTRLEEALKPGGWRVEIFDPVEHVAFVLDDQAHTARRYPLPDAPPGDPPAPAPRGTTENLGTQSIGGILAEGVRKSFGGLTIETWDSPDLKITLATKSSNGYGGRLENLSRSEPDPSRFRPPADYRIIEESSPLAMAVHK